MARVLSEDWLKYGLSVRPADRPRAEAAVTALYRLIGAPPPDFVWVPSPAAARQVTLDHYDRFRPVRLDAAAVPAQGSDWPLVARLADLASQLRERMNDRIGHRPSARSSWAWADPTPGTARTLPPDEALAAGIPAADVVEAVVYDALTTTLRDAVCAPVRTELMPPAVDAPGLAWYGQHDAAWVAHYDVFARVGLATYLGDDQDQLGLWTELVRSTGWWWPGDGMCVMAERPTEIHTEPQPSGFHGELRLHRDDGPAVRFADGAQVHVLHGTHVPEWVVKAPTVERIHAERNVEVRRSAIERIGWGTYIEQARLRRVGTAGDPGNPGSDLHLYDVPRELWGRPARLLLVVNGSVEPDGRRRRYGLSVPDHIEDPLSAAGWTYGLSGEQYARLVRRT
ncbi:hypothetical protein FGD71_041870 [Streptomyces sporangiiformans]|uniref:DUF6745 domain-containing protein n=1 Tax=Streptomyces sporangiiformans TaxID=2315329 RepID=A0A505DF10_9ACTN|nr:hypothetical protein FGD71_041870 [Streptomyces sporangiiformans]